MSDFKNFRESEEIMSKEDIKIKKNIESTFINLLNMLPFYIEAKVNDQIWCHEDIRHEIGVSEEAIDIIKSRIKTFERDLYYLKKYMEKE